MKGRKKVEKDTRKNRRIHKRVGIFKKEINKRVEERIRIENSRLGRKLDRSEINAIKEEVTSDVVKSKLVRFTASIGAMLVIGGTAYQLGAGSERIDGVSKDENGNVIINTEEMEEEASVKINGTDREIFLNELKVKQEDVVETDGSDSRTDEQIREEMIAQIESEVSGFQNKEDVWEYAKKMYSTEYNKQTGEILGINNFELRVFNSGNLLTTDKESQGVIEMVVDGQNAEAEEKWSRAHDGSTVLLELGGAIRNLEELREEYNKGTKKEELGKLNEKVVNSIVSYYDKQQEKEQNEQVNVSNDDGR